MNFKFFPQTKEEIEQMLKQAGMNSLDDLYADVPEQIRFRGEYDLPDPMSETEIRSCSRSSVKRIADLLCLLEQDATTTTHRL